VLLVRLKRFTILFTDFVKNHTLTLDRKNFSRSFGNRICDEINSDEETISSERGYYTLQSKDKRRNTPLFKSVKRIVKRLRRTNNTNTNSAINRDMNLGKEGHNPQTNEPCCFVTKYPVKISVLLKHCKTAFIKHVFP
jgi:hypothetical protein